MANRHKSNKKSKAAARRQPTKYVDSNSSASEALSALKQLEAREFRSEPSSTTALGNAVKRPSAIESGSAGLERMTGVEERYDDTHFDGHIENFRRELDHAKQISAKTVEAELSKLETTITKQLGENRDSIKNWFIGVAGTLTVLTVGSIYFNISTVSDFGGKLEDLKEKISSNQTKIDETQAELERVNELKPVAVEQQKDGNDPVSDNTSSNDDL